MPILALSHDRDDILRDFGSGFEPVAGHAARLLSEALVGPAVSVDRPHEVRDEGAR